MGIYTVSLYPLSFTHNVMYITQKKKKRRIRQTNERSTVTSLLYHLTIVTSLKSGWVMTVSTVSLSSLSGKVEPPPTTTSEARTTLPLRERREEGMQIVAT